MGIKMAVALDADGNEWQADDYVKGKGREPLRCKHCPTGVTHQNAYSCERHNKSIKVSAYFRLLQNGEHADNCPHAVEQNVKKLVTQSDGLIESLRNGKYRLRLMMVADALKLPQKPAPTQNGGGNNPSGTVYQRKSGSLPAYINSAKKVLLLRAACDDDDGISQYLELVFEGNTVVPWSSFYFETERYMEAFRAVSLQTVKHPIALHGVVKSKRSPVIDGRLTNVINLHVPKYTADAADETHGVSVEASIWADQAEWFDEIEEEAEIVVLGVWKVKSGKRSPARETGKYRFSDFTTHKLSLTLSLRAQIVRVPRTVE
ncbi:hypothetical protein [Ralstonia pseudosolanacearum]|uniref:hypothetical protein n=1 Tax=Ralstonia pseudosolanacearum TaxID=1310165 RepID=UPI003AAD21DB